MAKKKRIINYHNGEQLYNKEYIDELLSKKQDVAEPVEPVDPDDPDNPTPVDPDNPDNPTPVDPDNPTPVGPGTGTLDTVVDASSENAVQNKAIAAAINDEKLRAETQESFLSDRIDALEQHSDVQVGETMFWPQSEVTTRIVGSDDAVVFTFNGKLYAVEPEQNVEVKMCVAKNVPEGWAPCDGTARLRCEDYPELAKFFRGTRNENGTWNCDGNNVADKWVHGKSADARIWIPYCAQRIIKIKN